MIQSLPRSRFTHLTGLKRFMGSAVVLAVTATGFAQPASGEVEISRAVRVQTRKPGLFVKGMVAKDTIDLRGNNVSTDSFDSTDPVFSTGGRYDAAKTKDNGDVATNSGLVNSLSVGNANIAGHVATGPGGGISTGPNGSVGSKKWLASGKKGVEPGWASDDMNMSFPEVPVPFTGAYSVPSGNPLALTASGNWKITADLNTSLIVHSNVNAILYVVGDVSLSGKNDKIEVQPGASLRMYVAGANTSIKGQGVINNAGNATNFFYFGLPSNKSIAFGGNAAFIGAIYAPAADFTLGGGGSDTKDFIGASVTGTVKMNGHFRFHYDENLGRLTDGGRFLITSWNEIAPKK
jgi:hypothetical protein